MGNQLHLDVVSRERIFSGYLKRTLSVQEAADFEDHYLACDECFEGLRATELLVAGLGQPALESLRTGDVTVIRFNCTAELTGNSSELGALVQMIDTRSDSKVLIDLNRVSRIDSAGLGMLMRCYTHSIHNSGALKLLQPAPQVKKVLSLTKIDSVIPVFDEESDAFHSFR
jgi:anti-sigma B factor antagonist